jgi:enoyl-CoA hydratase/carnithine racemase
MNMIGHRQAELGLMLGTLYDPPQALKIGLVDEVLLANMDVVEVARRRAVEWIQIPPQARTRQFLPLNQQQNHANKSRYDLLRFYP